ncbi:hypothetical protein K466DRAFT_664529, partial [Polyporus arcularius HHB13444]
PPPPPRVPQPRSSKSSQILLFSCTYSLWILFCKANECEEAVAAGRIAHPRDFYPATILSGSPASKCARDAIGLHRHPSPQELYAQVRPLRPVSAVVNHTDVRPRSVGWTRR